MAQRVKPNSKWWHCGGVIERIKDTHKVCTWLIHLVVVLISEGVDAVGYWLKVLRNEDSVVLRAGNNIGLAVEDCRVVVWCIGQRVCDIKPEECSANGVCFIRVGRISRAHQRVYRIARREDIAHCIDWVTLVIITNGATKVNGVGGILLERVADSDDNALATSRDKGHLLHLWRGEHLLVLVLYLHILVELNVYLLLLKVSGEVIWGKVYNDRWQSILWTTLRAHNVGTASQKRTKEEERHGHFEYQRAIFHSTVSVAVLSFSVCSGAGGTMVHTPPFFSLPSV